MGSAYRVLTLNQISPVGLSRLPSERYEVGPSVTEPDAILVRSQDMHSMDIPATVKAIGRAGAGTNNIPVKALSQRGVPVFNAPGGNANAVKELVLAAMFLAARNIVPSLSFVSKLEGDDASLHKQVESGKKNFAGTELAGKTLGVIGLGAIGGMVADAALKLGMNVIGYDPDITVEAAWRLSSSVRKAHSVEEVLKASDFVSLHVPLVDATRHMIDHARVGVFRQGGTLLNFSRQEIVDEAAMLGALDSGRLRYYVCDFPSARLKGHPQVVATPHLGASTEEAEDNCAVMVANQVRDYLENGNIVNAVNFPNVQMDRESPFRVGMAHANVPGMVAQISSIMGEAGLNIHNMVNKSKGEMAYTMVDVDSRVAPDLIAHLSAVPGMLAVRWLPQSA